MLYIFGKRTVRVGHYIDHDHICYPCKSFDREISIFRPYFHICFIPVFPIGGNEYSIRCRNCGDDTRLDSVLEKYRGRTKTPIYLFSAWILAGCLTLAWFYWNNVTTKHKAEYIANPLTGDIYTIRKDERDGAVYYFMRVIQSDHDSVKVLHNNLDYGDFVSSLSNEDYFVKSDTVVLQRSVLKKMLDNRELYSIDRGYAESSNFSHIK